MSNCAISLKKIFQQYPRKAKNPLQVINNLNIDIPQGKIISFLGSSGCGKSTILRYIAGLQNPSSGEVFINGHSRSDADCVGMVFQQYSSLPWYSVLENVMLPLNISGKLKKGDRIKKAKEMIKIVGLEGHDDKYAKYPLLSGGQLQRVAIARSLLANPEIILLDEPFGALDIQTRENMCHLVLDIWEKTQCTILMVTHDIREAIYLSHDVVILSNKVKNITHHIPIDLPFPRKEDIRYNAKFVEYEKNISNIMRDN